MLVLPLLLSTNIASLALLAKAHYKAKKLRKIQKHEGMWKRWPITKVRAEEFDPLFKKGPMGPTVETEIAFFCNYDVTGGVTDFETWFLCNLAKKATQIFEFGTCTGKTTYLLAKNSSPNTKISTLTLHPEQLQDYKTTSQDEKLDFQRSADESIFDQFYYTGSSEQKKITQYFQDSKDFDETPYLGKCDLIFIDGSHAYSYVLSDSAKAMKMIRPGGVIIWHDYRGKNKTKGVFHALNLLATKHPLVHIYGTCMVAYRHK